MELITPVKDYMLSLWFSSTVFNCLLESFYRADAFRFVIDKNIDNQRFKTFLSTRYVYLMFHLIKILFSCNWYQICFGKFFPTLSKQYPNKHIDLVFHTSRVTELNLTENLQQLIQLKSHYYVDFHIHPWKNNTNVLARLGIKQFFMNI